MRKLLYCNNFYRLKIDAHGQSIDNDINKNMHEIRNNKNVFGVMLFGIICPISSFHNYNETTGLNLFR